MIETDQYLHKNSDSPGSRPRPAFLHANTVPLRNRMKCAPYTSGQHHMDVEL